MMGSACVKSYGKCTSFSIRAGNQAVEIHGVIALSAPSMKVAGTGEGGGRGGFLLSSNDVCLIMKNACICYGQTNHVQCVFFTLGRIVWMVYAT